MSGFVSEARLVAALRDIRRQIRDAVEHRGPIIHEAWTIPTIGDVEDSSWDGANTHSAAEVAANAVHVVPLLVSGDLEARFVSTVISSSGALPIVNFRFGLYEADLSTIGSRADRESTFSPVRWRKLAESTAVASTASASAQRVTAVVGGSRAVHLKAGRIYGVGWTMDDEAGQIFCPGGDPSADAQQLVNAYKTTRESGDALTMPDSLRRIPSTQAIPPSLVVRSATGHQLLGNYGDF